MKLSWLESIWEEVGGGSNLPAGDAATPTMNAVKSEVEDANEQFQDANLPPQMTNISPPTGNDPWTQHQEPPSNQNTNGSNGLIHDHKSNIAAEVMAEPVLSTTLNVHPVSTSLPTKAFGRGRGVSNLPAWMTMTKEGNNVSVGAAGVSIQHAAIGRGRGTSNLPAWMTNPASNLDTLKRRNPGSSLGHADDEQLTKKARAEPTISEYTLRLSLDSLCEPDFIDWLKLKIE